MRILILALLFSISGRIFSDDFTFRKTSWGMNIEEVKISEELKVAEERDELIFYKTRVLEKDVLLAYIFVDNKLVRAKYVGRRFG